MPIPGVPNNADGINGFDAFAPEAPYGEGTKQAALAAGAPLAGDRVASGPINAPDRAKNAAATPTPSAAAATPAATTASPPAGPSVAQAWATIAALPGITPLAQQYAERAQALEQPQP